MVSHVYYDNENNNTKVPKCSAVQFCDDLLHVAFAKTVYIQARTTQYDAHLQTILNIIHKKYICIFCRPENIYNYGKFIKD